MRTSQWRLNNLSDMSKAFETAAGTNTSSTADDILDFSERNPFGEVDDF